MNIQTFKKLALTSFLGCALAASLLPSQAAAQAMSPMREKVRSFADSFAIRVYPANPYQARIRMEVKVYDKNFRPIKDVKITPARFTLGGRSSRPVSVLIPFKGKKRRKVRICTESIPFPSQQEQATAIKAQVCGKFMGERVK